LNIDIEFGGIKIWIGIDDTDSRTHGCTTYLIFELIKEFSEYSLIGYPHLVRLNPNIPWKTRGNGAICIQLDRENKIDNEKMRIGIHEYGEPIFSHRKIISQKLQNASYDKLTQAAERVDSIITKKAALEDATTNPGVVVTEGALPIELYWSAVRNVVELKKIKQQFDLSRVVYKGYKKGRGIIGASAAIAWGSNVDMSTQEEMFNKSSIKASNELKKRIQPLDNTYELIAYRNPSRFGTQRLVNPETVMELDLRYPSTFNNYDYESQHVVITPNSPCPVLFGVRGDLKDDLLGAKTLLADTCEIIDKWIIFNTNQGTDDHLIATKISSINPYSSVIVTGEVTERPKTINGGHVLFEIQESNEKNINAMKITCAAYEPTKSFRNITRGLLPGDTISVYGGVRAEPKTINIEKLSIIDLVQQPTKLHNPRCPSCGRAMKSIGKDKGYRCRKCHKHQVTRAEDVVFQSSRRDLSIGFYEVPVAARRHLSKPLKRFNIYPGQEPEPPKSF